MAPASARGYFGVYTLPRGSEQVPNWSRVQRPVPNRFVLLRVAARGAGGEGAGDTAAGARPDHGPGRRRRSRPRRRRDSRGGLVRGGRDSSRRGERRRRVLARGPFRGRAEAAQLAVVGADHADRAARRDHGARSRDGPGWSHAAREPGVGTGSATGTTPSRRCRFTSGSVSTRRGRPKPVGDESDGRQLAWRAWGIRAALMRSAVASRKSTPRRGERLRRRRRLARDSLASALRSFGGRAPPRTGIASPGREDEFG